MKSSKAFVVATLSGMSSWTVTTLRTTCHIITRVSFCDAQISFEVREVPPFLLWYTFESNFVPCGPWYQVRTEKQSWRLVSGRWSLFLNRNFQKSSYVQNVPRGIFVLTTARVRSPQESLVVLKRTFKLKRFDCCFVARRKNSLTLCEFPTTSS